MKHKQGKYMTYLLVEGMGSIKDIVAELNRIRRDHVMLSKEEILFLQRLGDLFDQVSDEIRFVIRNNTRH